jgi:hypothetical protein
MPHSDKNEVGQVPDLPSAKVNPNQTRISPTNTQPIPAPGYFFLTCAPS